MKHKVTLRIVSTATQYRCELAHRGGRREFEGPCESPTGGVEAALQEALSALKSPCFVECYIDESATGPGGWSVPETYPHVLQVYYLEPADDPAMRSLKEKAVQG